MRVLVIGSGGREHALCWAIAGSPLVTRLWCAPGNPGISHLAECVSVGPMDIPALVAFAQSEAIDLVVPGPEGPLVAGITDAMEAAGISCFGPRRDAVWLESSKSYTKEICVAAGIPTARWWHFDDIDLARDCIRAHGAPIVVKADGLAAGKGVVVATTENQALDAIDLMMSDHAFGSAGESVVIEEFLVGQEVSFFALCDGTLAIPLGAAQDHKRVGFGDTGPNTGGMGAYSPVPFFAEHEDWTMDHIIRPALAEMAKRGTPYRGVLFAGLMLTADGVKLIEFNVRFGDPETQALVLRMKSDLLAALCAVCDGTLDGYFIETDDGKSEVAFRWSPETAISVVMAAPGYPEAPTYGSAIDLTRVARMPDVQVFHAGTEKDSRGHLRAVAGRVLTVCATGADLTAARASAYSAIDSIGWPEGIYRRDIGRHLLGPNETC